MECVSNEYMIFFFRFLTVSKSSMTVIRVSDPGGCEYRRGGGDRNEARNKETTDLTEMREMRLYGVLVVYRRHHQTKSSTAVVASHLCSAAPSVQVAANAARSIGETTPRDEPKLCHPRTRLDRRMISALRRGEGVE